MSESQREKFDPPEIDPWRKEKTGKVSTVRALVQSKVALLVDRIWSIGHACFERIFPEPPIATEQLLQNNPRLAWASSLILLGRVEEGVARFEEQGYFPSPDILEQGCRRLVKQWIITIVDEDETLSRSEERNISNVPPMMKLQSELAQKGFKESLRIYKKYCPEKATLKTVWEILEELTPEYGENLTFQALKEVFSSQLAL